MTLRPPKNWYLDFVGDVEDAVGVYTLQRLGRQKTMLVASYTEKYKIENAPTKREDIESTKRMWDTFGAALEKDYARAKRVV